jgi:hypothetical protein
MSINKNLEDKVVNWWMDLSIVEKDLLIEMLYYMDSADFEQFGIEITNDGYYERVREHGKI